MKPANFDEFLIWYTNHADVVYAFEQELRKLCISDTDILKQSLMIYRDITIAFDECVDPLLDPITAGYCL